MADPDSDAVSNTYEPDYSVMVPCAVCGRDCPEPLGLCPGPMDGTYSECEETARLEKMKVGFPFRRRYG
jgi:hypothetical protein